MADDDGGTWPEHPKPYWRDALSYARAHGWTFRKHSDHAFGEIRCAAGGCRVVIFSTGVAGESAAIGARKKVDRCPHQSKSVLESAERSLTDADRLLDAAESLCAVNEGEAAFAALPDGSTEVRIAELITEIERHAAAARSVLDEVELPRDAGVERVIGAAKSQVSSARTLVVGLPDGSDRNRLKDRLTQTQSRLYRLQRRLQQMRAKQ